MAKSKEGLQNALLKSAERNAPKPKQPPHGVALEQARALRPEAEAVQASIEAEIASEQAIEGAARWLPKIKHEIKLLDDIEAGAHEATPDYVNGITRTTSKGLRPSWPTPRPGERRRPTSLSSMTAARN
ncbi:MAG: hypothetical protein IPO67_22460 [Deltaproteobacteria bacterium]|nr:hypothetical protein [Deltaproteobacteria bacterium]